MNVFNSHYALLSYNPLLPKYRLFFGGGSEPYWLFNLQYVNWHSSYILKELEIAQEECSLVLLIWKQIRIQPY
jgi:hypothetical protein